MVLSINQDAAMSNIPHSAASARLRPAFLPPADPDTMYCTPLMVSESTAINAPAVISILKIALMILCKSLGSTRLVPLVSPGIGSSGV
jgi:hypothetical protein